MTTPEGLIKRQIRDYLNALGIYHRVIQLGGIGGRSNSGKGISDIIGVLKDGRFLAIEIKTQQGRLSEEQREFLDSVSRSGGLAFVARSLDDVASALKNGVKIQPGQSSCVSVGV